MIGTHVCEDRRQQRIAPDVLVEARGQAVQRVNATEPFVEGRNVVIGHGTRVRRFSVVQGDSEIAFGATKPFWLSATDRLVIARTVSAVIDRRDTRLASIGMCGRLYKSFS
jgi:hypothetical protein